MTIGQLDQTGRQMSSEHVRSALVCDILDELGRPRQALGADIVPMVDGSPLIGPAFTAHAVEVEEAPAERYVGLLGALDAVPPRHVLVLGCARTEACAMWGELLSRACAAREVLGTITDGYARDIALVRAAGYPLFARGSLPLDIHGRCEIAGYGEPVELDGVTIRPGDLVVADVDGVAVVPAELVDTVLPLVAEKAHGEELFRAAVTDGMLPSEAYRRFKVL
jgi:4-hydroxy-4-methyl-2-oxoglutarate aldolase